MTGYRLSGSENLQQFVNQQVEIRGTLVEPGAAATAAPGATTTTAAQADPNAASPTGQPNMQTLRITSVRLLSGACPGGR
jgi:hypothetical protein